MRLVFPLLALCCAATMGQAGVYDCNSDALMRAGKLLKLHWNEADSLLAETSGPPGEDGSVMAWSLDDQPAQLPAVKAQLGDGMFDVLEVNGYVYRATYRMRFTYAQSPDVCVLMGQEIVELADPY